MKLEHISPTRAIEKDEARSLLMGQTIGLAAGNPLLLATMNLLEFFRGKVLWAVTCEKEALQEAAIKTPVYRRAKPVHYFSHVRGHRR